MDLLIEVTQAPGLSAYNRAERRMYHLSRALTGVVLPVDTYGTHLHNGKTIDHNLEVQNFQAAGEVLGKLFEELVIDGHSVTAEYISTPPLNSTKSFVVSPLFRARHMFESQYMTCYMKCDDKSCCSPVRTSVMAFFPNRRMPALIPVMHTKAGPEAFKLEPEVFKKDLKFLDPFARIIMEQVLAPVSVKEKFGLNIPYDVYFPTQQKKVERRVCQVCYKYFSTLVSLGIHKKACKKAKAVRKPSKQTGARRKRAVQTISSSEEEDIEVEVTEEVLGDDGDGENDDEVEETDNAEDMMNDSEDENLEVVTLAPTISVLGEGDIEIILNLKEFLKLPWSGDIN